MISVALKLRVIISVVSQLVGELCHLCEVKVLIPETQLSLPLNFKLMVPYIIIQY